MLTTHEFHNFTSFALPLVESGKAESIGQLLKQWQALRDYEDTVEVLRRSYEDMQAGRGTPAEEAFSECRRQLSK